VRTSGAVTCRGRRRELAESHPSGSFRSLS
jgi:hypothetical protein